MWERRHLRGFMTGLSKDVVGFGVLLVCLIASLGKSMILDVMDGKESCVIIKAKKDDTIHGNFELLTPVDREDFMVVLKGSTSLLYKKEKANEGYFTVKASEDSDYHLCFVNKDAQKQKDYANLPMIEDKSKKGLDRRRKEDREEDRGDNIKAKNTDISSDSSSIPEGYVFEDDIDSWYALNPGFKTVGFGLRLAEDDNLKDAPGTSEDKRARFLTEEAEILMQKLKALNDHEGHLRSKEEIYHSSVGQTASRLIWYTFIEGVVLLAVSWTQLSYIRRFFETKRIM